MPDAELALRAATGDRAAWTAIHDRYGDRLYDYSWSIVRDGPAAADAVREVFWLAAGRIGTLRDPELLVAWLYGLCRERSLVMARRRRRAPAVDVLEAPEPGAALDELRILMLAAEGELTPKDRAVLELHLRHGMAGDELAVAMGTDPRDATGLVAKVREHVERSFGALLVARTGRGDCARLDTLLGGWDGRPAAPVHKRVARHVAGCAVCAERRATQPGPLALLAGIPLLPAPLELRELAIAAVADALPAGTTAAGGVPAAANADADDAGWRSELDDDIDGSAGADADADADAGADAGADDQDVDPYAYPEVDPDAGPYMDPYSGSDAGPGGPDAGPAGQYTGRGFDLDDGPDFGEATVVEPDPQRRDDERGLAAFRSRIRESRAGLVAGAAALTVLAVVGAALISLGSKDEPTDVGLVAPTTALPTTATTTRRSTSSTPHQTPSSTEPSTTAAVTTTVPPPALVDVITGSIDFGASATDAVLRFRNTGGVPLPWLVTSPERALTVSPGQGTLPAGGTAAISVRLDRAGLREGDFATALRLVAAGTTMVPIAALENRLPSLAELGIDRGWLVADNPACATAVASATVTDESPVTVAVLWQLDGGPVTNAPPSAEGIRYAATIGPAAEGTIRWWVTATDSRGNSTRSPDQTLAVRGAAEPCP